MGQLVGLGLPRDEARVFVALVGLETATSHEVVETSRVPRMRVDSAIESLHDRGLLDVQYATPQTFRVVPHETTLRTLRRDHQNLIERLEVALYALDAIE